MLRKLIEYVKQIRLLYYMLRKEKLIHSEKYKINVSSTCFEKTKKKRYWNLLIDCFLSCMSQKKRLWLE